MYNIIIGEECRLVHKNIQHDMTRVKKIYPPFREVCLGWLGVLLVKFYIFLSLLMGKQSKKNSQI